MRTLFHISTKRSLTHLSPRVPEQIIYDRENSEIKRVCFAPKIGNCLNALNVWPGIFYVYSLELTDHDCLLTPKQVQCYVKDAMHNNEYWCLNNCNVNYVGKIEVLSTGKSEEDYNIYGELITFNCGIKWKWINKNI